MAIKSIADLDENAPKITDAAKFGALEIRTIKATLKKIFPGQIGDGFAKPIVANEDELNYCVGLSSKAQTQLDSLKNSIRYLNAPVGTKMLFMQFSAPLGWTQLTTGFEDGRALRVVSTSGGGIGGSDDPKLWSHTHDIPEHKLTISEMPSHRHRETLGKWHKTLADHDDNFDTVSLDTGSTYTTYEGGGNAHSHGRTTALTFSPRYVDVIMCVKD